MFTKKLSLVLLSAFSVITLATGANAATEPKETKALKACNNYVVGMKKANYNNEIPSIIELSGQTVYLQSYYTSTLDSGKWVATYSNCPEGAD
ncbi:hypothetical protein ABE354_22650 [Brevibacillus laterosporus]|uniref:hypothetical protein n=1 Tax=Brevibacillus laterosporus TaxID=1465 RepID=UPI003D1BF341